MTKRSPQASSYWQLLTGSPDESTMENRAFNYVSIITMLLLLVCLPLDIYLGQRLMSIVIAALIGLQLVIYYFSRFRRRYHTGIVFYAVCSYIALIVNYFTNSGSTGPTLFLFPVTFLLLVTISRPVLQRLWIFLHITVVAGLLLAEYSYPKLVPNTYVKPTDRYLDVTICYLVAISLIFSIVSYLRSYYTRLRNLAEDRAHSISEQNELITAQNAMLEKVNEEKNKLFSIISHDLRSPIDSITGFLELLTGELLTEDEEREMLDALLSQTRYTSELLQNILFWSRTQMQGVSAQLKPISLKPVIDRCVHLKTARALQKGVKLTCGIPAHIEGIADENMLVIVLRNVVTNAIKFTPAGGEIFVSAREYKGHSVRISVKDTGIGIPEHKKQNIFTLHTESTNGTDNESGVGMGLMLCKEFMEYQHGNIAFESEPGIGTEFFLTLPKAKLN